MGGWSKTNATIRTDAMNWAAPAVQERRFEREDDGKRNQDQCGAAVGFAGHWVRTAGLRGRSRGSDGDLGGEENRHAARAGLQDAAGAYWHRRACLRGD